MVGYVIKMKTDKFFVTTMDNEERIYEDIVKARAYQRHIFEKYGFGFMPRIYPL
jgi:hypothetical protein